MIGLDFTPLKGLSLVILKQGIQHLRGDKARGTPLHLHLAVAQTPDHIALSKS